MNFEKLKQKIMYILCERQSMKDIICNFQHKMSTDDTFYEDNKHYIKFISNQHILI